LLSSKENALKSSLQDLKERLALYLRPELDDPNFSENYLEPESDLNRRNRPFSYADIRDLNEIIWDARL